MTKPETTKTDLENFLFIIEKYKLLIQNTESVDFARSGFDFSYLVIQNLIKENENLKKMIDTTKKTNYSSRIGQAF